MSRISHFQRFSQPENHATNNTLLAFRYFYQAAPFKLQRALTSLLDTELTIGLAFDQQVRGSGSVPDALISQEPLQLFFETKRGNSLDFDQIERHIQNITTNSSNRNSILIGITREPISQADRNHFAAAAETKGIKFVAITFSQVVESLRQPCADHEVELLAIVDDYEAYLLEEALLEEGNQWLVVVPCGTSINENVRYGVYYEPASRPSKLNYRFLGLYAQKAVAYVGCVRAIYGATFSGSDSLVDLEAGVANGGDKDRILEVVRTTQYYDLKAAPHRFYLVEEFLPFGLRKTSPGGIQGLRYLDMAKIDARYNPRVQHAATELVSLLKDGTWE